jgi:hypothetical protein
MTVRRLALLVVLLALAAPSAAPAQDPFSPIPPAPPEPQRDPGSGGGAPADDGTFSTTQLLLIGGAAFALLAGIGFVIVRDARRAAPVGRDETVTDVDRTKGSRTPPKQRVKRQRAKARAARQSRKRNR